MKKFGLVTMVVAGALGLGAFAWISLKPVAREGQIEAGSTSRELELLEERLETLEGRVRAIERTPRPAFSVEKIPVESESESAAVATIEEMEARAELAVIGAIESRAEEELQRRADFVHDKHQTFLDALGEVVELTPDKHSQVLDLLDGVSDRLQRLIREGQTATRPWPDVRAEMARVRTRGQQALRQLLNHSEQAAYEDLSSRHGPAIVLSSDYEEG